MLRNGTLASSASKFAALLVVIGMTGCDDGSVKVYPVKGTVNYQGKPLDNAIVNFLINGKEGQPSTLIGMGTTDKEGKFTIQTTIDPTSMPLEGAVEGEHQVTISKYIPPKGMTEEDLAKMMARETALMEKQGYVDPKDVTPSRIPFLPPKYQNPGASELSAKVEPGGANEFTFDLK